MGTKIAINGFGRIGRCVARILAESQNQDLEIVGINDLTKPEVLAHLLKYDSVHRTFRGDVKVDGDHMIIGGRKIRITAEKDPSKLPWRDLDVDVVMECTGVFRDKDGAGKHLAAGAKRVIISAPGKNVDGTFCVGINTDSFDPSKHTIVSNASCTTNCLAPVTKVLHETYGVKRGHMVTVHSYTNDQGLLDQPHKDLRRARAAAMSMVPTSTGAAAAIGLVIPELEGKLDGTAIRVPTADVSIVCLTAELAKDTTVEDVNEAMRKAAKGDLKGVLGVSDEPLVSSDFIGDSRSSIVDTAQTAVIGGNLVEVQSWYDNEWGFSQRMIDLAHVLASKG